VDAEKLKFYISSWGDGEKERVETENAEDERCVVYVYTEFRCTLLSPISSSHPNHGTPSRPTCSARVITVVWCAKGGGGALGAQEDDAHDEDARWFWGREAER
jgi:hypothetical protein